MEVLPSRHVPMPSVLLTGNMVSDRPIWENTESRFRSLAETANSCSETSAGSRWNNSERVYFLCLPVWWLYKLFLQFITSGLHLRTFFSHLRGIKLPSIVACTINTDPNYILRRSPIFQADSWSSNSLSTESLIETRCWLPNSLSMSNQRRIWLPGELTCILAAHQPRRHIQRLYVSVWGHRDGSALWHFITARWY